MDSRGMVRSKQCCHGEREFWTAPYEKAGMVRSKKKRAGGGDRLTVPYGEPGMVWSNHGCLGLAGILDCTLRGAGMVVM